VVGVVSDVVPLGEWQAVADKRRVMRTYIEPVLGDLRLGHLARAILAVLEAGVEVGEALHLHGEVLFHFVQFEQTVFRNSPFLEISLDLFADGDAGFPIQSGEDV
jgi:hypothetical protein